MSMIRCARRAAAIGRMSPQDARRLEYIYAIAYRDAEATTAGHGDAERAANEAFDRTLTIMAQERRRAAHLQYEAEQRLLGDASRWRNAQDEADLGHFLLKRIDRLHFEAQAMFQLDMAELSALTAEFRRTVASGRRLGRARADLMIRELHGENTGDAAAKAFADAVRALTRRKIEQFNGAGGAIAVREDWAHPQNHDSHRIATEGFDAWRAAIIEATDPQRMINPDTGLPFRPHEYEEALPGVFEQIVTHDAGNIGAGVASGAALWRRRNDPRFFVFKDADSWMRYHERFGGGEHPLELLTGWLRGIDHDIASMQVLGPNPEATIRYFAGDEYKPGGRILHEATEAQFGRAALFPAHRAAPTATGKKNPFRTWRQREQHAADKALGVVREWQHYSGIAKRPHHKGWTYVEATINTSMYGAKLAFTAFLTPADLANQAATRAFNSVSVRGMMRDLVDALQLSRNPKELTELGIEVDTGLTAMMNEAREHAFTQGHPFAQWLTDRALTFTGLKPLTMGYRAMWTLGTLREIARHQRKSYSRLPADFRAMLERYDIDEGAWEVIQAATPHDNRGMRVIRPKDIESVDVFALAAGTDARIGETVRARPGLTRGQEVALRVMTMIRDEGEYATITGSPRSQRILPHRRGTILGTLAGSTAKLRQYTIQHFIRHGERAADIFWRNGGGIRGAAGAGRYYALSLLFPAMFLVGVGDVISQMAQGKDPPDVSDWKFWDRIFWRTISLGFFQDVFAGLFDPQSRLQSGFSFAGPTLQVYSDMVELGSSAFSEEPDAGRQAIRTVKNVIPRTWATDLAVDRLVWDNLQRMVDPEAEADFQRRARRVEQGWWWGPGQAAPERGPNLDALDLGDRDQDLASVR